MIFINPQTDKSLFEHSECEQGLFFIRGMENLCSAKLRA